MILNTVDRIEFHEVKQRHAGDEGLSYAHIWEKDIPMAAAQRPKHVW